MIAPPKDGLPPATENRVAVIIATRNRATLLGRALATVERARAATSATTEILVVDNGSTDHTGEFLRAWAKAGSNCTHLQVPQPGKARALNAALASVRAPLLLFTDDDVEVHEDWLTAIVAFFERHPEYVAAMGRVRLPPAVSDPDTLRRVAYFGTLPLFDKGDQEADGIHLYGCNMAVRRATFDRIGLFNERLGPGAGGLHEDGDLARRILRAGLRIGYMPGAIVYHTVDPDRLTPAYFRTLQVSDARSRFELSRQAHWIHAAARLAGALAVLVWRTATGQSRRRMRALGRVISHREMLRLRWHEHRRRRRHLRRTPG